MLGLTLNQADAHITSGKNSRTAVGSAVTLKHDQLGRSICTVSEILNRKESPTQQRPSLVSSPQRKTWVIDRMARPVPSRRETMAAWR